MLSSLVVGTGARLQRNNTIDAFRGFSILIVLGFHYLVRWAPPYAPTDYYQFDYLYSPYFALGQRGVELFFVISGLVITMTAERARGALDFGVRRFARLFPALAIAAPLTAAVLMLAPPELRRTPADVLASLSFFPQAFGRQYVDGVYWSLTVEVRFYAIVAAGLLLFRTHFWIAVALTSIPSMLLASRGANPLLFGFWPYFLVGMGAWYWMFERKLRLGGGLALLGIGLWPLIVMPMLDRAFMAALILLMLGAIRLQVAMPFLPTIGRISYSLYLTHQLIGLVLISILTRAGCSDAIALLIAGGTVIVLSGAMQRYVEEPGARVILSAWNTARAGAKRWTPRAIPMRNKS